MNKCRYGLTSALVNYTPIPAPEQAGIQTEHVRIYGNGVNESASWNGYGADWHYPHFNNSFVLEEVCWKRRKLILTPS